MIPHSRKKLGFFSAIVLSTLLLLQVLSLRAAQDVWTGVERVIAVGDVHGDYDQFVAVLQSAGLIDAQGHWSGGKTHLVQTGDILDRGTDSRKVMDLLIRLEQEAPSAGGQVHALTGNHEAMNVYGDLRYVTPEDFAAYQDENSEKAREQLYKKHQESLQALPPPGGVPKFDDAYRQKWEAEHPLGYAEHRLAFGSKGVYGKWIRGDNAVIQINRTLFLHAGISPKYAGWNIQQINDRVRDELRDFKKLQGGIAMDGEGPLWYRGLAHEDQTSLGSHVKTVLKNYQVERIVIGHTFTEGAILPRFDGKVLLIDIGLARLYDSRLRMSCLLIENGRPYALHRGKKLTLPSESVVDMLRYFKEAEKLDPPPSSLAKIIAGLEARLAAAKSK